MSRLSTAPGIERARPLPPEERCRRPRGRSGERGHVLITATLFLVPLLGLAALAVDAGSWYVEQQRNQRAADAAALAAVPLMPDLARAQTLALQAIQHNGYPDAVLASNQSAFDAADPGSAPTLYVEAEGEKSVRVQFRTNGLVFFGQVFGLQFVSTRSDSTSRYVKSEVMGNPTSALGNGVDGPNPDHYWLNILPESHSRNAGDLVSAQLGRNNTANPNYDAQGYLYRIDVPDTGTTTSWRLQVRPSCYRQNQGQAVYSLYYPDSTEADGYDNVSVANLAITDTFGRERNTGDCDWTAGGDEAQWHTISDVGLYTGSWTFQARHAGGGGRVLYSLRIVDTAGNLCSVTVDPGCPTIAPLNWLGAFTQSEMFGDGSPTAFTDSELYIAEVGSEFAGNTLELLLFDPADGIDAVKIRDPKGNFADFTWDTIDIDVFGYSGGGYYSTDAGPYNQTCDGDSVVTSPNGTDCDPSQPERNWFQDRTVRIHIPIPEDPCGSDCWWKLVYVNSENDSNETTTWRAAILGDPVRLID